MLFHVSEDPYISVFRPRLPPSHGSGVSVPVVWAIDEAHLPNYMLPRDCPRVGFAVGKGTSKVDITRFFGSTTDPSGRVVVIETAWLERCMGHSLWIYRFSEDPFSLQDAIAGYYVAFQDVIPMLRYEEAHPIRCLIRNGVTVVVVDDIWKVRDAVIASTLEYSCIRMRNALPRTGAGADGVSEIQTLIEKGIFRPSFAPPETAR